MLDDSWLCVEILNNILFKAGKSAISAEQYQKEFNFPVIDYYRKLGFDFAIDCFDELANDYIAQYNKKRFDCKLQNGAEAVLKACADLGFTQSILSAYQQCLLEETVGFFKLRDFFTKLVGLDDYYAAGKIENARLLIDELKFSTDDVLLIGDTIHDFEVAKAIGVDCILIPSGHNSKEKLQLCQAELLDSLNQVPVFIEDRR